MAAGWRARPVLRNIAARDGHGYGGRIAMRSPSSRPAGAVLLAVALSSGCATPARHLTTRAVDDPMTVPRRLMAVSLGEGVDRRAPAGVTTWATRFGFSYGMTDKLELDGLSFRYAFLDDAPPPEGAPPDTPRRHLSLAVRAGVDGIGASSLVGFIVLPTLFVDARKHLGTRLVLWADAGWNASWVAAPLARDSRYTPYLWPNADRASKVEVNVGALVQVVDHLTLAGAVGADDLFACTFPTCSSASQGLHASVGPAWRPWRWVGLSVAADGGARWRRVEPVLPPPPTAVLPEVPPTRVSWVGLSGAVAFFW